MSSSFIADLDKLLPPPVVRWLGVGNDADLLAAAQARYIASVKQAHQKFRRNFNLGVIENNLVRLTSSEIDVVISRVGDLETLDVIVKAKGLAALKKTDEYMVAIEFVYGSPASGGTAAVYRQIATGTAIDNVAALHAIYEDKPVNLDFWVYNPKLIQQLNVALPLQTLFFPDFNTWPDPYGSKADLPYNVKIAPLAEWDRLAAALLDYTPTGYDNAYDIYTSIGWQIVEQGVVNDVVFAFVPPPFQEVLVAFEIRADGGSKLFQLYGPLNDFIGWPYIDGWYE